MRYTKAKIKEAIEQSAAELFEQAGQPQREKLFLTQKQYDLDPEGWKKLLKQRGLSEDAIEIIPAVFDIK